MLSGDILVEDYDGTTPQYFLDAKTITDGGRSRRIKEHTMLMPRGAARNPRINALIVHEACHAISDIDARKGALRLDEEVVAFVSHAMYLVTQTLPPREGLSREDTAISNAARAIAHELGRHKAVTDVEWQALRDAIRAHPNYRDTVDARLDFSGVPRRLR
jgi:hypothetical protein